MSHAILRDLLNDFSDNINNEMVLAISQAIDAAENHDEDSPLIFSSFSTLITLLYQGFNNERAVAIYLSSPDTANSVTRQFFIPFLQQAQQQVAPHIEIPADFGNHEGEEDEEDEDGARAPGIVPRDYIENNENNENYGDEDEDEDGDRDDMEL